MCNKLRLFLITKTLKNISNDFLRKKYFFLYFFTFHFFFISLTKSAVRIPTYFVETLKQIKIPTFIINNKKPKDAGINFNYSNIYVASHELEYVIYH